MKGGPEHLGKAAVFAAVVREGSFSAGARAMGLARSTASEHVATLETVLGVRLLERTTRSLRPTEEGELLFARIDEALRAWEDGRRALEERTREPAGLLRVTSPGGIASSLVAPICGELIAAHERLNIELVVDDRFRDLVGEGIDVAIRMAPLADSSLVCRKLGETTIILVASPSLAEGADPRERLEGILAHPWVGHCAIHAPAVDLFDREGRLHSVRPTYRAEGSNTEGQFSLVGSGCGLALIPELLVRPEIAAGRMVRAYPSWRGRRLPIYAVYSRTSVTSPRVARFLELVSERLDALR